MKKFIILFFLFTSAVVFAQDYALKQLENSPRHHEWVEVTYDDRTVHCFVAYPEKSASTMAMLVIHENRGLTDWVRSFADQMAEAGYIAIAPDLLSGFSKEYQKTNDFPSSDEARKAIYQLEQDQVSKDLDAVQAYAAQLEAANGTTGSIGFCWGGSQSFRFASTNDKIAVAFVFYGTAPKDSSAFSSINVPVYGFYGSNDQRVNATIPRTDSLMRANKKNYTSEIFQGAGHAFMRRGDNPDGEKANVEARNDAWEDVILILDEMQEAAFRDRNRKDDNN